MKKRPPVRTCGECTRFKEGTGLRFQYCPVCKWEVEAKDKACQAITLKED